MSGLQEELDTKGMNFEGFDIAGPFAIQPLQRGDERGHFAEIFRADMFATKAGTFDFVQENESLSSRVGTIRGLHFQTDPFAQGKLVRCVAGELFDVAVDIRSGSASYGRWISVILSASKGNQLWVPPGFAHGFCTLEPNTVIAYKTTAYYSHEHDKGIAWDDPTVRVNWPTVATEETLSAKDRIQPRLADLPAYFIFGG